MTKDEIKDFSLKITQSSKTGLVVITYEIIENYLESAIECYNSEDIEGFSFNVKKAKQFLNDLSSNLDFHYKISFNLMSLYMYVNNRLVSAAARKSTDVIRECLNVIRSLKEAFKKIEPEDKRGRAMPNSDQIYVGLTYGKGSKLNEYSLRKSE